MTAIKRIKCPYCSEFIAFDAQKCRFCGEWLNRPKSLPSKSFFTKKRIILGICLLVGFLVIKDLFSPSDVKLETTVSNNNEKSLQKVVEEQYKLLNSRNPEDLAKLYQNFYSPEHSVKKGTEADFVKSILAKHSDDGLDHYDFTIHSIKVNGLKGYVDRTQKECQDSACNKVKSQNRSTRLYFLFNGKWLMTDQNIFCTREVPYQNPDEFNRAYSLIIQRTEKFNTSFADIKNCVQISYAESDEEMTGAEGQFSFVPGQSAEKLEILVSPRYKAKDDLITAVLLMHELTHAEDYVGGLLAGKEVDCFKTEANAFQNQNWLIYLLNPEERASIDARLSTGASEELRSIKYYWDGISRAPGSTNEDRALNFVKSIPAYQKQCAKK